MRSFAADRGLDIFAPRQPYYCFRGWTCKYLKHKFCLPYEHWDCLTSATHGWVNKITLALMDPSATFISSATNLATSPQHWREGTCQLHFKFFLPIATNREEEDLQNQPHLHLNITLLCFHTWCPPALSQGSPDSFIHTTKVTLSIGSKIPSFLVSPPICTIAWTAWAEHMAPFLQNISCERNIMNHPRMTSSDLGW